MGNQNKTGWWPALPAAPLDWELTSILLGRPLAALILYPVRNTANPNLITILSLIFSLVGTAGLAFNFNLWFSLALLFVAMVLDDGDGLLARYQEKSSFFGSMLDKMADVIRFGLLFPLLGYFAYKQAVGDHAFIYIIMGSTISLSLLVQGYTKWVYLEHKSRTDKKEQNSKQVESRGTGKQNIFYGIMTAIFWPFHECDLTIWIIVMSAFSLYKLLIIILFASQTIIALISIIARLFSLYKLDSSNQFL
ncbi:MAG: CDP-alcohol phosphatidyltransferase family protein [Deltaproteobacteria bacterium]|jgi:phosphatidylglycerophosphate synthase|nr:CDP-alcohol phosphatidyltransferase family protein [Deltaproteobacteria bacterium]